MSDQSSQSAHGPTGPIDGPEAEPSPTTKKASEGAAPLDPRIGARIGRYRIRDVIASGGMGTVYLAVQESPRRKVALKLMHDGVVSAATLRRFEFESQLLARLRHPGIAQVFEAGTHGEGDDAVPYFAMEYVPNGRTLTEFAAQKGLDTKQRLALFAKACDAVAHGHEKGIIHRDLKPSNILVDSNGQPKVIDFGVARTTDSDMAVTTLLTELRQLIGTLQYMSPEQCAGDSLDIDTRSDVYALGVVLYELLCGQLPYDLSRSPIPVAVRAIQEETPPRPSTHDRTLRGDVETIVMKSLDKDRRRRYRSAAELGDDVCRYLDDEPITARPPGVIDALRRVARKHKVAAAGLAGAVVVLLVAAVVVAILLSIANAALRNSVELASELWETESEAAPARWAGGEAEQLATRAVARAASAMEARDAGDHGSASEGFILAIGSMREATQRHAETIPRLVEDGLRAAREGHSVEAEEILQMLRGLGVGDTVLRELEAQLSLHRLRMIAVPGHSGDSDSSPELGRFHLSETEVTQGQFMAILGRNPSAFDDDLQRPVENVSWYDAVEFANALSRWQGRTLRYRITGEFRTDEGAIGDASVELIRGTGFRLPTRAEWEHACRAGAEAPFSFGVTDDPRVIDRHMWFAVNSDGQTHAVASKAANAWGLHDMHGNVAEWCFDEDGRYRRIARGGSYRSLAEECGSGSGDVLAAAGRYDGQGFRVALDQPGVFLLPLEGPIGERVRSEEVVKIAERADEHGPGQIIILKIASRGGSFIEASQIEETIREVSRRHRVVAWVDESIAGGAMISMSCTEIYFMTEGVVGWPPGLDRSNDPAVHAKWMAAMVAVLTLRHSEHLVRAILSPRHACSYDKNPETGEVTFYGDLAGQYVLSAADSPLSLGATNALHCGFSFGTADTEGELLAAR